MRVQEIARLHLRGGGHVAAASGLVRHDGHLWVVSDDEPALARFADPGAPGELRILSDERLPADPVERKASKPDLEALAVLPDGSLLALGSGSTERRERGFRVRGARVEVVDLGPLYSRLRRDLHDLNVEGCAAVGDRLWLAQRGNGAEGIDALVECDHALRLVAIHPVELPDGLNFTDLAPLPDGRLAFAAVHETGGSTYEDGDVTAVAVGVLDGVRVAELHPLSIRDKIEGILPVPEGYLLVADPDDPSTAAPLLRATCAGPARAPASGTPPGRCAGGSSGSGGGGRRA